MDIEQLCSQCYLLMCLTKYIIITTRNVFDSIVENVLICNTLNMSNHNIGYMSIAINDFTNIVNVETCNIHVFNCAWKKATT